MSLVANIILMDFSEQNLQIVQKTNKPS